MSSERVADDRKEDRDVSREKREKRDEDESENFISDRAR